MWRMWTELHQEELVQETLEGGTLWDTVRMPYMPEGI